MARVWDLERNKAREKLERIATRSSVLPQELRGVILGDEPLRQLYGTPAIQPLVFGGIHVTENMKAFLSLPLKFRVFP